MNIGSHSKYSVVFYIMRLFKRVFRMVRPNSLVLPVCLLFGCLFSDEDQELTQKQESVHHDTLLYQSPESGDITTENESSVSPVEEDPYKDFDSWCENPDKQMCECSAKDPIVCKEPKEQCGPDRTGMSQQCVRPRWSRNEGSWIYMCSQRWLNRREQKEQYKSLSIIVDSVCKEPSWAQELRSWGKENRMGEDPGKLCWRLRGGSEALSECLGGHFCQPDKLTRFLALVASRESSWNHTTTHELNFDLEANRASYGKAKKRGWYADNEHFYAAYRWGRGYGWFGQNASLSVFDWDPKAPPEILCRRPESTEIYLRKARRSFKKLWSRYRDDVERVYTLSDGKEVRVKGVTWYDVHRAVSTGKLDPEGIIPTKKGFLVRAKARKIDPFETVMFKMLGEEIPKDRQNEIADEIRQRIDQGLQVQDDRESEALYGG